MNIKNPVLRWAFFVGVAAVIAGIRALSIHYFIAPNNFAPGGVTGIAVMVQYLTNNTVNSAYIIVALNIPLSILAYKYLSKTFALISVIDIALTSVFLLVFDLALPKSFVYTEYPILAAVAGGVISGGSLAIMFKIGGSTGGTDIVAALIQKKHNATNVAWFILAIDVVIALVSGVVFMIPIGGNPAAGSPITPVLLAICAMFTTSKVSATVSHGLAAASKCEIITDRPEELAKIIMEKMGRGVTFISAKGMHTGTEKGILIVIIRNRQMSAFKQLLKECAKDSFAYVMQTSEVLGRGFTSS